VLSTHDKVSELNEKIEDYLAAGIPLVWIIDPLNEIAYIHRQDGTVTKVPKGAELNGENILPGFTCKITDLLPPTPSK
jgi:Uma2 family endonuclease